MYIYSKLILCNSAHSGYEIANAFLCVPIALVKTKPRHDRTLCGLIMLLKQLIYFTIYASPGFFGAGRLLINLYVLAPTTEFRIVRFLVASSMSFAVKYSDNRSEYVDHCSLRSLNLPILPKVAIFLDSNYQ